MKKRFAPLLLVLCLAVSLLAGCGGAASTAASTPAEPEPTPAPTAEPTPTPEPEPVPYAEEHGLQFAPAEDFTLAAVMYNTDDKTLFEQTEALYTFEGAELTDNEDGTETLALRYTILAMVRDFYDEPDYLAYRVHTLDPWDTYTGIVCEPDGTDEETGYTLVWQDESWPVSVGLEYTTEWGGWFYNEELNTYDEYGYAHCTNYVTYPKGYDGLAFRVDPSLAPPSEEEDGEDEAAAYLLDSWVDGTVLIRASDLIAACAAG